MLGVLRAGDVLACAVAFQLAWVVAPWVHPAGDFSRSVWAMCALTALVTMLPVFTRMGLYMPQRTKGFFRELTMLTKGVFLAWCLSYVTVSLLIADRPSRVVMGLVFPAWVLVGGVTRIAGRSALRAMRRRGWNLRHAAIVGTGRLGQRVYHTLRKNKWMGIEPAYFIHAGGNEDRLLKRPVLGPYEEIERILADRPVDIVFLAMRAREHAELEQLLERLSQTRADIRVVPDMLSYNLLRHDMEQMDNLPVVSLTGTPLDGWNAIAKRLLDVVASGMALVVLSPVMGLLAMMVRRSGPGPVFYRQVRTSLGGKPFTIIKFRTMVEGAEKDTGAIWSHGEQDPRVTPIGRWMRRWNLDELPQFWNVFRGDMSLVGPRPERPQLVERFGRKIPRYMLRQHAKAGLTGWAQVNGLRGRTSLRKRVQYDLFYLCNWSLGFDLKILILTLMPWKPKRYVRGLEGDDEAWSEAPPILPEEERRMQEEERKLSEASARLAIARPAPTLAEPALRPGEVTVVTARKLEAEVSRSPGPPRSGVPTGRV
jgi:exopolysaccharide biosynthesis polyprenyl glycosylphosphotransferase